MTTFYQFISLHMAVLLATSVAYMEIFFLERMNLIGFSSHMACLLETSGNYGQNILVIIEIIRFQEHSRNSL